MKTIEIDDDLYFYIASQTKFIGESASDILRRLVMPEAQASAPVAEAPATAPQAAKTKTKKAESKPVPAVNGKGAKIVLASLESNPNKSKVEVFLEILAALHQAHGASFAAILGIKGRNRLYFADSKDELLKAGSSTNPKQIPGSDYWVVTNNNTAKKISMLKEVVSTLGYNDEQGQGIIAHFAD